MVNNSWFMDKEGKRFTHMSDDLVEKKASIYGFFVMKIFCTHSRLLYYTTYFAECPSLLVSLFFLSSGITPSILALPSTVLRRTTSTE